MLESANLHFAQQARNRPGRFDARLLRARHAKALVVVGALVHLRGLRLEHVVFAAQGAAYALLHILGNRASRPQRGWSAPGSGSGSLGVGATALPPEEPPEDEPPPEEFPEEAPPILRSRNQSRSRSSLKYSDRPRTPAPRHVPSSRIRPQRPRPYSSEQRNRNRRAATRSALPAAEDPRGRTARPHQVPKPYRPMWCSLPPGHSRLRLRKKRRRCRKGHARP